MQVVDLYEYDEILGQTLLVLELINFMVSYFESV
jgi:hypothetical protein